MGQISMLSTKSAKVLFTRLWSSGARRLWRQFLHGERISTPNVVRLRTVSKPRSRWISHCLWRCLLIVEQESRGTSGLGTEPSYRSYWTRVYWSDSMLINVRLEGSH